MSKHCGDEIESDTAELNWWLWRFAYLTSIGKDITNFEVNCDFEFALIRSKVPKYELRSAPLFFFWLK
jgi:hypothetical protein